MKFIPRSLSGTLERRLTQANKVVILYGARQTGKTTLVRRLLENLLFRNLEINADELRYVDALSSRNLITLKRLVAGYELVFIDEAQRVPDIGIRNILIDNLSPLSRRNDTGRLWENFLVVERRKALTYAGMSANAYFWRTYTGAELDYVEERGGQLNGFEMKVQPGKGRIPRSWHETYPQATGRVISLDNWLDFVTVRKPSQEPGP